MYCQIDNGAIVVWKEFLQRLFQKVLQAFCLRFLKGWYQKNIQDNLYSDPYNDFARDSFRRIFDRNRIFLDRIIPEISSGILYGLLQRFY